MGLLDGKVAVITGSGRGIGRSAALMMAQEGAKVVVSDLDETPARETAAEITAAGGKAVYCVGDVTSPDFAKMLIGKALDTYGDLHVIVNNAGYTWDGFIHKMTDNQWQAMFDVHITATFRILREASEFIREKARVELTEGRRVMRKVVNIMSVSGTMGNIGQVNYSAAKSAIGGLTKSLAKEWGQYNVNCNAIAFGFISTRLGADKENGELFQGKIPLGVPKKLKENAANLIPMCRPGTPEEAAGGILFLASPLSDYVTGHILHVDGGVDM